MDDKLISKLLKECKNKDLTNKIEENHQKLSKDMNKMKENMLKNDDMENIREKI